MIRDRLFMFSARTFAVVLAGMLASYSSPKPTAPSSAYATNGPLDGGYNPYPDGGGGTPQYTQAPPPPPPGFPGPVDSAPSSPKPKPKPSTASKPASKPSSTPTKKPAVASSGGSSKPSAKPTPKPAPKPSAPAKKPASSGGGTHVVVKGDTLYGIARKNGTTVPKIMSLNGLSSDKLKIGQKLKLP